MQSDDERQGPPRSKSFGVVCSAAGVVRCFLLKWGFFFIDTSTTRKRAATPYLAACLDHGQANPLIHFRQRHKVASKSNLATRTLSSYLRCLSFDSLVPLLKCTVRSCWLEGRWLLGTFSLTQLTGSSESWTGLLGGQIDASERWSWHPAAVFEMRRTNQEPSSR